MIWTPYGAPKWTFDKKNKEEESGKKMGGAKKKEESEEKKWAGPLTFMYRNRQRSGKMVRPYHSELQSSPSDPMLV